MKTHKIMDIDEGGMHLVCIKTDDKWNPYRLYEVRRSYDNASGTRRTLLTKFGNFESILYTLVEIAEETRAWK